MILDYHNDLRRKVAKGEEIRGTDTSPNMPQYGATDMNALTWDADLATVAQRLVVGKSKKLETKLKWDVCCPLLDYSQMG